METYTRQPLAATSLGAPQKLRQKLAAPIVWLESGQFATGTPQAKVANLHNLLCCALLATSKQRPLNTNAPAELVRQNCPVSTKHTLSSRQTRKPRLALDKHKVGVSRVVIFHPGRPEVSESCGNTTGGGRVRFWG